MIKSKSASVELLSYCNYNCEWAGLAEEVACFSGCSYNDYADWDPDCSELVPMLNRNTSFVEVSGDDQIGFVLEYLQSSNEDDNVCPPSHTRRIMRETCKTEYLPELSTLAYAHCVVLESIDQGAEVPARRMMRETCFPDVLRIFTPALHDVLVHDSCLARGVSG